MKQTIKLSIIYFKEQVISAFAGFSKKAKAKTLPTIILLFLVLSCAIGYSLYNFADMFNLTGNSKYILIVGFFMALIISLMLTLTDTQGVMYRAKDYNLLSSLPIKNVTLITSKFLGAYLTTALYYLIVAIPTFIVYFIFNEVTAFGIIFCIFSVLFMPLFAQFISSVLGFLVNALTAKMKNKNIVRTIFSLVFAISLAVFISLSSSNFMEQMFVGGLPLWFKIVFSNIYFLFTAITTSSFVYYLYAILVSLGFAVLGILVVMFGYKKINSNLMVTKIKGKPVPITYSTKTPFTNLFKKEISTFFNSSVYCVNGLMGIIMSIVSVIIALSTFAQFEFNTGIQEVFSATAVFCMAMCLGVAPTTSVTISMEGSKLQNLKSLPIKFKDIVLSKCALNLMITVPVIFIGVIILSVVLKLSFLLVVLILFYLLFTTLSQTILGLLLNLKFPRLNWTSETQAVKNGASMLLTMALDMLIAMIPMIVFFLWFFHSSNLTFTIYMPIMLAIQAVYCAVLVIVLIKKGEEIYNKIQV